MPNQPLADIHVHTSMRPYLNAKNEEYLFKGFSFKPSDTLFKQVQKIISNLAHISLRAQSSFDEMYEGGLRVASISLSPMEIGFGIINDDWKNYANDVLNLVKFRLWDERNDKVINLEIIDAITGFSLPALRLITDSDKNNEGFHHYYNDYFVHELQWLLSFDNKKSPSKKYTICFPKNGTELTKNLQNDSILNVLLSVEGAHSFRSIPHKNTVANGRDTMHKVTETDNQLVSDIAKSIQHLKQQHSVPVCWTSICHHFWNGLSGHARSLNKLMGEIVNQNEGLNTGLNMNGKKVIEDLARTDYGDGKTYHPILVDIKHFSPQARIDFYAFRKDHKALKNLPIVCSHTGISIHYRTLADWNKNISFTGDIDKKGKCYLHEDGINLCQEDLVQIYNSNGLIGIQLDEKRIMGLLAQQEVEANGKQADKRRESYAKAIWGNIYAAIHELEEAGIKDLKRAWNMFSIGSDYDGLINHLDDFETAASFSSVKTEMANYMLKKNQSITLITSNKDGEEVNLPTERIDKLKAGLSNEEIVKKVFGQNAIDFFITHFK